MAKIGVTLSATCAAALLIGLASAQASTIPSLSQSVAAPEQAGFQLAENKGSRQYHGYRGAGQSRNSYDRSGMGDNRNHDDRGDDRGHDGKNKNNGYGNNNNNNNHNGNNNNNASSNNNQNNGNNHSGGSNGRRGGRGH